MGAIIGKATGDTIGTQAAIAASATKNNYYAFTREKGIALMMEQLGINRSEAQQLILEISSNLEAIQGKPDDDIPEHGGNTEVSIIQHILEQRGYAKEKVERYLSTYQELRKIEIENKGRFLLDYMVCRLLIVRNYMILKACGVYKSVINGSQIFASMISKLQKDGVLAVLFCYWDCFNIVYS